MDGLRHIQKSTHDHVDRPSALGLHKDQQPVTDRKAQVVVGLVEQLVIQRDDVDLLLRYSSILRMQCLIELQGILRIAEQVCEHAVLDLRLRAALLWLLLGHAAHLHLLFHYVQPASISYHIHWGVFNGSLTFSASVAALDDPAPMRYHGIVRGGQAIACRKA